MIPGKDLFIPTYNFDKYSIEALEGFLKNTLINWDIAFNNLSELTNVIQALHTVVRWEAMLHNILRQTNILLLIQTELSKRKGYNSDNSLIEEIKSCQKVFEEQNILFIELQKTFKEIHINN